MTTPSSTNQDNNNASDSDSFSSDSDDEFLTLRDDGDAVDREALIRKKLLENFYGKTATSGDDQPPKSGGWSSRDSDDEEPGSTSSTAEQTHDLDALNFHAPSHTAQHVLSQGVHPLLDLEEQLACQVRTLDSSLQTLVYENYSRFIDATDALKSIGTHVQAHVAPMEQLQTSMQVVSDASISVETSVSSLRDQVVEKLRVKRLLQRLDTLLKLPVTLQQQLQCGKYRQATSSYLSAYSILSKHSEGFESLQRIEIKCHGIVQADLLHQVKRKLRHWSGNGGVEDLDIAMSSSEEEDVKDTNTISDYEDEDIPDPPNSIADIFECAGTPPLILRDETASHQFQVTLTEEECQEMSLQASLRLLERVLDTHHLEWQEELRNRNSGSAGRSTRATSDPMERMGSHNKSVTTPPTSIVPTHVLDSILEASTLYSMTFVAADGGNSDEQLSQFVIMAFNAFLQHVRSELLDQNMSSSSLSHLIFDDSFSTAEDGTDTKEDRDDDEDDSGYQQEIAHYLALLLQSVRQLASGLSLPDVAISPDLASGLVDQTVGLTEAMVRRRVDSKFTMLRWRVLKECLTPLVEYSENGDEQEGEDNGDNMSKLLPAVQRASVALSDSLQLMDDTVRSILSKEGQGENQSSTIGADSTDLGMLQQAVEQSTKRFARWLASTMEQLAGCESSDAQKLLQVSEETKQEGDVAADTPTTTVSVGQSQDNDIEEEDDAMRDLDGENKHIDSTLVNLIDTMRNRSSPHSVLAIAEMCRVAERSVMDSITHSIATHGDSSGAGARLRKASLFSGDGESSAIGKAGDEVAVATPTSLRFRLAGSRVLALYAIDRGHKAAEALCSDLNELSNENEGVLPSGPRAATCRVLDIVKATCQDCADLFGGDRRAAPLPDTIQDEYPSLTASLPTRQSMSARSGLVFDVERMFAEKVVVYPHPSHSHPSDFGRNPVVILVLKVAFKALIETARWLTFSEWGYQQLVLDLEFLKWILPHYVTNDFLEDGTNGRTVLETLFADVRSTARDRASQVAAEEGEDTNQARAAIRVFIEDSLETPSFVIDED